MFFEKTRWFSNVMVLGLLFLLLGSAADYKTPVKKRYRIEQGSRLYLDGTSNVNKFTCDCEDQYPGQTIEIERNGGYARFRNADLILKSKNFDCHNRKIDHDMQVALKADQYPYIKASLIDTWQDIRCLQGGCQGWFDVQAKTNLTIAKTTRELSIPAKARIVGPNQFQLKGEQALQMSAFGIAPPEAMFGMIKVNDWIVFHFDLLIQVEDIK